MRQLRFMIGIALVSVLLVLCANLFFKHDLPVEGPRRLEILRQAGLFLEAETLYRQMLPASPQDADLQYAYILNHFNIPAAQRDDSRLLADFRDLTRQPGVADLGWVGLGCVYIQLEQYQLALSALERVQDIGQKYYHLALGQAYAGLEHAALAEYHYRQEISHQGAVQQAVSRLAGIYVAQGQAVEIHRLLDDQQLAPYVTLNDRRRLALVERDGLSYLRHTFMTPFSRYQPTGIFFAGLVCLTWLVYLRQIHFFGRWPVGGYLMVIAAGALFAPLTFILTDITELALPWLEEPGRSMALLRSILQVGLLEELVKLFPVLLFVFVDRWLRRALTALQPLWLIQKVAWQAPGGKNSQQQPSFNLLMVGCLSALGFATLENAGYFSRYGLGLVFPRFWYSTVMHMAMTCIVCLALDKALKRRNRQMWPLLVGLGTAALVHGIFDFFLTGQDGAYIQLGLALMVVVVREFHRGLMNALNLAPGFSEQPGASLRLDNYGWLAGMALLLLALLFGYFHLYLSTDIANQQLTLLGVTAVPAAIVVLAALGHIPLKSGYQKPAFPPLRGKLLNFRQLVIRSLPQ